MTKSPACLQGIFLCAEVVRSWLDLRTLQQKYARSPKLMHAPAEIRSLTETYARSSGNTLAHRNLCTLQKSNTKTQNPDYTKKHGRKICRALNLNLKTTTEFARCTYRSTCDYVCLTRRYCHSRISVARIRHLPFL